MNNENTDEDTRIYEQRNTDEDTYLADYDTMFTPGPIITNTAPDVLFVFCLLKSSIIAS